MGEMEAVGSVCLSLALEEMTTFKYCLVSVLLLAVFRGRVLYLASEITRCACTYGYFGCCLRMSCTGGSAAQIARTERLRRPVLLRVSGDKKSARFQLCIPAVWLRLNSPNYIQVAAGLISVN